MAGGVLTHLFWSGTLDKLHVLTGLKRVNRCRRKALDRTLASVAGSFPSRSRSGRDHDHTGDALGPCATKTTQVACLGSLSMMLRGAAINFLLVRN